MHTPASRTLAMRTSTVTYPGGIEHVRAVRADLRPLLRARTRPQTVPVVTHPPVTAPARANRAVLPRQTSCRRAKITFKGAPKGTSPAAMAQAPPLKLIFHGKLGAYREDDAVSRPFDT